MKNIKIVLSEKSHVKFVLQLENMILVEAERNNMLQQSSNNLIEQIIKGKALLAFAGNDEFVGYTCLEVWKKYIEIGAVIVNPSFRKCGTGTALIKNALHLALNKYSDKRIIILSNTKTCKISLKLGFIDQAKDKFDEEIWSICPTCKDYQNFPNCRCQAMVYP